MRRHGAFHNRGNGGGIGDIEARVRHPIWQDGGRRDPVRGHDDRTVTGEGPGQRAADAAGRAGDQRGIARQQVGRHRLPPVWYRLRC
jgi:hypothetical protein